MGVVSCYDDDDLLLLLTLCKREKKTRQLREEDGKFVEYLNLNTNQFIYSAPINCSADIIFR